MESRAGIHREIREPKIPMLSGLKLVHKLSAPLKIDLPKEENHQKNRITKRIELPKEQNR